MAGPYSLDLRVRVVAAVSAGLSCRAAAAKFSVGAATVVRWAKRNRETGSPAALPMGGSVGLLSPRSATGCWRGCANSPTSLCRR